MRKLSSSQRLLVGVPGLCAAMIAASSMLFRRAQHPPSDLVQGVVTGLLLGIAFLSGFFLLKNGLLKNGRAAK